MLLNHTSFYRTIFLMSLDRTSFYWIIRHSIGSYTSCHWIRLHFIGSYVYLLDRIFYVIGSGFMSLQHIILSGNHIHVIGSIFMSLDRRPFDRTIHVMPLDRTSCHWIRNVIPSGQRLIEKGLFPRKLFQIRDSKHGAHLQGQHRTTQELIESSIITVLLDVLHQLASNADLDYDLYKVEWLCSLVVRLGGMFEQALLPNLRQAHDLISLMIRHNEESSVTGNKG